MTPEAVAARLHALFIAAEGTSLRREDRKKAVEVAALLNELSRLGGDRLVVDAAAGKAYVGLLAADLLGFPRVVVIERDAGRARAAKEAAARLAGSAAVAILQGDAGDPSLWPGEPDAAAALHACGEASDRILDAAVRAQAKWLFLVPCCYSGVVPFSARAEAAADEMGAPRHAAVRRQVVTGLIDAERTLRLEAAGYETAVVPFVPASVTPHNLLWRARRVMEPRRMAEAAARLARLRG
ncbi:MAG: methyltransferase [Polyangiaceae bacterium]|nr:methyltransferase [Polyangiaceae bacterium]